MAKFVGIEPARISWQAGSPVSEAFGDIYFSAEDGVAESHYVFLQHNQLPQRFKEAKRFCIVETGFGTGLNFLVTVQQWLQTSPKGAVLEFHSIEKHPMTVQTLQKLYAQWPQFSMIQAALLKQYPCLLPGRHLLSLFDGRVQLNLWLGEVQQMLPQLPAGLQVDAWFLDGFAPAKNPDMWQMSLFQQMARFSYTGTTFATFTAAGQVRRGLQSVGFQVKKAKGFGRKRELCFGQWRHNGGQIKQRPLAKPPSEIEQGVSLTTQEMCQTDCSVERSSTHPISRKIAIQAPWFAPPPVFQSQDKTAIVVGAGLAGAALAYALAKAGYQVTVLEAAHEVASQASGNAAGAIHPLVTADWNLRSQFYLQGFATTLGWLKPWLASNEVEGALNGLLQLAISPQMAARLQQALQRVNLPTDFAQGWSPQQIYQQWGFQTPYSGLFFPQGGWVNPKTVVQACLKHKNIQVQTATSVRGWEFWQQKAQNVFQVETSRGDFQASVLAVTTGALAEKLNQALGLDIRPVKGQVSMLDNACVSSSLRGSGRVVTHQGYSVFKPDALVTGATFEAPDLSASLRSEANDENIAQLQQALPNSVVAACDGVQARVGFRPTTADHLPIVGVLPNWKNLSQDFLQQNASKMPHQYPQMTYQSGLLVSNGHGARGLMSVFLAAEELVRQLQGQPSGLSESCRQAIHPARFAIRQWRRRKA